MKLVINSCFRNLLKNAQVNASVWISNRSYIKKIENERFKLINQLDVN